METAVLVYSHASAAGPVRRDVPLPPDFARVAVYEKEAVHAGYGKRANHIIGSKAHHHSEWQQGREDAGFRRRMAERADGLFSGQTGTVIRGWGTDRPRIHFRPEHAWTYFNAFKRALRRDLYRAAVFSCSTPF